MAEAFGDLGRTHRAGACGGDLQGEGEPVQPPAQVHDGVEVGTFDAHAGLVGALEEQLDRRPGQRIGRADAGYLERRQRDDGLAGQLQRRAAGGQHRGLLADLEDTPDRAGRRFQEVLAVVDQEQHLAITGRVQQRLERLEPQLRGERARHRVGIVDVGQVPRCASRARKRSVARRHRLAGKRGLAHTARPDQRDETPGPQPAVDVVELVITTEQPHPPVHAASLRSAVGRPEQLQPCPGRPVTSRGWGDVAMHDHEARFMCGVPMTTTNLPSARSTHVCSSASKPLLARAP